MKCPLLQASFKTMFTRFTGVVSVLVALCVLPNCLLAQVNQARMLGTVADQSGGVIAGATVTITDVQKKHFAHFDHRLGGRVRGAKSGS
jgi:hypothetical protein